LAHNFCGLGCLAGREYDLPAMTQHLVPRWLGWQRARATPDEILRAFDAGVAPVDVRGLCFALGVKIVDDPALKFAGTVDSSPDGAATITVKAGDPEYRKRFTIAHELGHLMCHGPGEFFRDTNFAGDRRETEANAFAADLLLPRYLLRPLVGKLSTNALASLFAVSPTAMNIQIEKMSRGR
jgi:hypothetical protein